MSITKETEWHSVVAMATLLAIVACEKTNAHLRPIEVGQSVWSDFRGNLIPQSRFSMVHATFCFVLEFVSGMMGKDSLWILFIIIASCLKLFYSQEPKVSWATLFLHFLLSFSSDWENINQTLQTFNLISKHLNVCLIYSALQYIVYFNSLLGVWKHDLKWHIT